MLLLMLLACRQGDIGIVKVYEDQTAILANYYRLQNKLVSVDGIGTVDEITHRLYSAIDN